MSSQITINGNAEITLNGIDPEDTRIVVNGDAVFKVIGVYTNSQAPALNWIRLDGATYSGGNITYSGALTEFVEGDARPGFASMIQLGIGDKFGYIFPHSDTTAPQLAMGLQTYIISYLSASSNYADIYNNADGAAANWFPDAESLRFEISKEDWTEGTDNLDYDFGDYIEATITETGVNYRLFRSGSILFERDVAVAWQDGKAYLMLNGFLPDQSNTLSFPVTLNIAS